MEAKTTVELDEGMAFDEQYFGILPNGWYSDPRIFELELSEIFMHSWQYAGAAGMVSRPGRFMTTQVGRLPVLISRGEDGELNAMANVCQHRGTVIAEGDGQCKHFQCPYHGWTYDLDGTLVNPLGFEEEIDYAEFSLPKLRAEEWGPFVFVAPPTMEESVDHFFSPLRERFTEATGVEWEGLHHWDRRSWELDANWKVVNDNYIECYHCGHVHPSYCKYVDMDAYVWEYGTYYEAQAGPNHPLAYREGYVTPEDAVKEGMFVHVWPNTYLQVYPGDAHNVSVLQVRPVSPERTITQLDHYFGPGAREDEMTRLTEYFAFQLEEDWAISPRVQAGLNSGAYRAGRHNMEDFRAGRLNVHAEKQANTEEPIRHFHRLYYDALTARHRFVFNGNGRASANGHSGWPSSPGGWRQIQGGRDRPIRSGSWTGD